MVNKFTYLFVYRCVQQTIIDDAVQRTYVLLRES